MNPPRHRRVPVGWQRFHERSGSFPEELPHPIPDTNRFRGTSASSSPPPAPPRLFHGRPTGSPRGWVAQEPEGSGTPGRIRTGTPCAHLELGTGAAKISVRVFSAAQSPRVKYERASPCKVTPFWRYPRGVLGFTNKRISPMRKAVLYGLAVVCVCLLCAFRPRRSPGPVMAIAHRSGATRCCVLLNLFGSEWPHHTAV
jgi:hypothetical protein